MSLNDLFPSTLNDGAVNPEPYFDRIAAEAGADLLGAGVAGMLRAAPPGALPDMFEQLFVHSHAEQQAALLNRLLAAAPEVARSAAGGALELLLAPGGSAVSSLQTSTLEPSVMIDPVRPAHGSSELSTLQATALRPDQVAAIGAAVAAAAPGVLDEIGRYYAQYPLVVKKLGNPALLAILRELQRRLRAD